MDVRSPDLVGREHELAALHARLAAARNRHGNTVFLSGEAGIGKSRLLRALATRARDGHATVLAGRAVPTSSDVAFRPVAEALAQALRGRDLPDDPALARWLPTLRVMLPALGGEPEDDAARQTAESTAHICGEAVIQLLRSVRGTRPIVVMLEDLHWADPDTLEVVEYLADNLADEPVLCVGTLRDEPPTAAVALARRVGQRGAATHVSLGRLDDDAVAQMVTACRPEAGLELIARVQAIADGVPLLVEEVLATPGVPASVGEAVRTRVAAMDDDHQAVLHAAAVLGRDFDWRLLPAVTGMPLEEVTAALEQMVENMLVSVDGDGFRFRHALTREAVVATLVPPRRTTIASAALAALDAARPDHDHADVALQAGDRSRAGALLAASGAASLRRGALATAVGTLRRAVDLLDGEAGTQSQAALVEALSLAGRLDEALDVGKDLLTRLGTGGPSTAAVHLELAQAAVAATHWPTAVAHLDAARGLLAAAPDARLAARADVLQAEVALAADDLERAREAARRALAAAESLKAPQIACHALELIGRSHRVHDLDAARHAFGQAYQAADAAGLPVWRLRAQHELGTIELLHHAGTDTLLTARGIAEQLGAPSTAVVLDLQLAATYLFRFELDTAQVHARRAVTHSRRLRLGRAHAVALIFQAECGALRADRQAMEDAVAEASRIAPDDAEIKGFIWSVRGAHELLWGERDAAAAAFDRATAALHTVTRSAPSHYRGLWALLHAVTHRSDAAECVSRVRASGATVQRANRGYLQYADAVLTRNADAVAAGDGDLGHVPVWHQLGRALVAEAALTDGWGAPHQWLREARACFDAHHLDRLARQCARLLGEAPRWSPAGVTARESEVLQLVAVGLANKEIAARLHLSVRTVEKHVESLLRKAGARSRTQLAAMVGSQP